MRFRKVQELPPTFDFDMHRVAFVSTVWLIYTTVLVRFALGRWGTLQPEHARYVWVIAPMVFLAQVTMDLRDVDTGTSDPVGALLGHGTAPLDGPAIAYMAARLLPIAGFGLLLVSELAVYLFSLAAPEVVFAYLRHPVMAVHAASLSYYVREFAVAQPAMTDAFGRQVYPLRYVLWCGSVSSMLISVYYVVECTLRTLRDPMRKLAALHDELAGGLLAVNATMTLGFFAGLRTPWGRPLNAVCLVGSCYGFYAMLGAIDRMLAAIQATAAANHARGVAWQFRITRGAVVIVWHAFPAVWALAASDAISPEVEHVGYISSDLLAKFLLMFVYVASVNNHSTHRQIHHANGASPLAAAVPGVAPAVGVPLPANGVALR